MLFNSYEFILFFLPFTVAVFFVLTKIGSLRLLLGFLVTASLFFYGWWNPAYLLLLSGSLVVNFTIGKILQKKDSADSHIKYIWLFIGITLNLIFLGYYKYGGFITTVSNDFFGTSWTWTHVMLPLAISFFTFQQIAYLIDSASSKIEHVDFLEYALFVTFFPQLIAGPIVHHKEMMPQFRCIFTSPNLSNLRIGLVLFVIGLAKKSIAC